MEGIENVGRLIGTAGNERAEERNVIVGNVPVGNPSGLTIADVVFGE